MILLALLVCVTHAQYKVDSASQNASSVMLSLSYTGNSSYYVKPTSLIAKKLVFTLWCHTRSDLSFKITDPQKQRFEIPEGGLFPLDPVKNFSFPLQNSDVTFSYTQQPFSFKIQRSQTKEVLFDSSTSNIVYSDYYLEISTVVPSKFAYGLGERFSASFKLDTGKYTIFNRDRPGMLDYGTGYSTYGHYPLYVVREPSNDFHLTLFRNSNAMDVMISNHTNSTYTFTYKVIGGVLDFRVFVGGKEPEELIKRFHEYTGRSAVPPFWAMGFHQSRWGYRTAHQLETVIKGYEDNDIPLDTIWSDIDYMLAREDFTIDEERFPLVNMSRITSRYNYVPILDAGIKISGDAHQQGVKRNVFLKDAEGGDLVGEVWPGRTNFVDFFHPNASAYWSDMLDVLYQKVKFSGVWLDMNEVSNFCNGPCVKQNKTGFDYTNDLPYAPGADDIESHTISLNATHYGGIKQADVHSYFGLMECAATYNFLKGKGLRPFVLTRSSTVGSNRYTFHWTGDNAAHFDFLKHSIVHNFMFQIWGVQMVGADICGFTGNTTVELCSRWFQLGAFYPFSRNHNYLLSEAQQAYALGQTVKKAAHTNIKLRYSLLKHYYRQFVSNQGAGSIFRPLFFEFSADAAVYNTTVAETQFLLGRELMFAPIVEKGQTSRLVYFPQGSNWWNFYTGNLSKAGTSETRRCELTDAIPLFIRQGTGIFYQDSTTVTRVEQLDNRFSLKTALMLDAGRSTEQLGVYSSTARLLSIRNFSDEASVSQCLQYGCEYAVVGELNVTSDSRILRLSVAFDGSSVLMQEQLLTRVEIYYGANQKVTRILEPPVSIKCNKCSFDIELPLERYAQLTIQ